MLKLLIIFVGLISFALSCDQQIVPCFQTQQCIQQCGVLICDNPECYSDIQEFKTCEAQSSLCQQVNGALQQCTSQYANYQYPQIAEQCYSTCNAGFTPQSEEYKKSQQCIQNCMPCYSPTPTPPPPGQNTNLQTAIACIQNNCAKGCQSWNQNCMQCDENFSQGIINDLICQQAFYEWEALSKQGNLSNYTVPLEFTQCYAQAMNGCSDSFFNTYFMGCQLSCLTQGLPQTDGQKLQTLQAYTQKSDSCPVCLQTANFQACQIEQQYFDACITETTQTVCQTAQILINQTAPNQQYPYAMVACNQTCAPNSTDSDFYTITQCWLKSVYIPATPPSSGSRANLLSMFIFLLVGLMGLALI